MANRIREEKCPAADCPRGIQVAGYCDKHYRRMKSHGSLTLPRKPSESERFWAKVNKAPDCWEWTGYVSQEGYGMFRFRGRTINAHRASYELAIGPIPAGLEIDHLCRNRKCIKPEHLEAVPKPVNILRGVGTGAKNAQKTHCINGHALTADNIYPRSLPDRQCVTCARAYASARYRRLTEQRTNGTKK